MAIPIVSNARVSGRLPNPKDFGSMRHAESPLDKDFLIFGQFNFHKLFANEIFTFKEISLQINIYCFAANNNCQRFTDACA